MPGIVGVRGAVDDSNDRRRPPIRALAPVEVIASNFESLSGIAVNASGAILLTDRAAGTLVRIEVDGRRTVLLSNLRKPSAVVTAPDGAVLVLDQGGRHLVRRAPDGAVTVVTATLKQARGVASSPDGRIWVAMRRVAGRDRDDDDDDKDRDVEYVIARLDDDGTPIVFASGFVDAQGLAADAYALYIVMGRLAMDRGRVRTTVARIAVRENGGAGPIEPLLRDSSGPPSGVAIDAAGGLFITSKSNDEDDHRGDDRGAVLKRREDGALGTFAAGIGDPAALAFAPNGDLVVAEQEKPGRVLRFLAPQVQLSAPPRFVNETPFTLRGASAAGARVVVSRVTGRGAAVVSAIATGGGMFAVRVPLESNVTNALTTVATGAGGLGLIGGATPFEVVHDDVPPALNVMDPLTGAHARGPLPSRAQTDDDRSGVAALAWNVDGVGMAQLKPQVPGQSFDASTVLPTAALVEGLHGIEVVASDRAGNRRTVAIPFIVDRTPPDTLIIGGPVGEIAAKTATFTVSGRDAWSSVAQLDYAWRLDGGAWSAFNALASITLDDLLPGEHRFEARARDRALNEDPTPAAQTFAVRSLRLNILEPAAGTVVTSDSIWVRATVEGGMGEVVASVPLPVRFGVASVAAPVQGGMVALQVPVDPTFATLTLIATDASGASVQANVSIVVVGVTTPEPRLELWPPGGLAPLVVRIALPGSSGSAVAVDTDGDGVNEFEGQLDGDELSATYERAGVYVPTVRITTPEGQILTRRGSVEVYDRAVLDVRLQSVWSGFKDAIRSANVQAAVNFITEERRAAWAEYFSSRPAAYFASIDRRFADMTLVEVGAGGAQYEVVAERNGLLYSYAVWFRIDDDGRWRLWRF